jgi:hypothetical protein
MSKVKVVGITLSVALNSVFAATAIASIVIPIEKTVHVCMSETAATTTEATLVANACAAVAQALGMDVEDCTAAALAGSWIRRVPVDECAYGWKASTTTKPLGGMWEYSN